MARMLTEVELSQNKFLMSGGSYELALLKMRKAGTMPTEYIYNEYPKALRISHGVETVQRRTETCDKGVYVDWVEIRENFEDIIVGSEDEEERVLSGGKTSAAIEEDRMGLIARCHTAGIPVDPSWSAVRLRRTLGDALDAPPPGDNMAALRQQLAQLEEIAAMKAKIAALQAQLAGNSDASIEAPIEELGDARGKRGKVPA